jgi:hypothetical protein
VQQDPFAVCELAHPRRVDALELQPAAAGLERDPSAGALHRRRKSLGHRGADRHAAVAEPLEVLDRALAHEPARVDHDDVIDRLLDLGPKQRGPAARRALAQQAAQPADALRWDWDTLAGRCRVIL